MFLEWLLAGVLALQIVILFFLLRRRERTPEEKVENAFYRVWRESGIDKAMGELTAYIREIQESFRFLERALRAPQSRGALGELALESILSDQLPPDMFGIRERVLAGLVPDAYIRSAAGIICIDSKFPLDNYMRMQEAVDEGEREAYRKRFLSDVRNHLSKIERDYVKPQMGTAQFAFAYIPSEAIYWFLVNEAFDMVRDYIKRGVHIVSPLTLSHKIEIIKTGLRAKKLSEEAEKIAKSIEAIQAEFKKLDANWKVFYETHLKNLWNKAGEIDSSYRELKERFDSVRRGLGN